MRETSTNIMDTKMIDCSSPSSQQEVISSNSCLGSSILLSRDSADTDSVNNTRSTLQHMRFLESTTYKRPLPCNLPEPFNGLWRQQIVEWMYTLVKHCNLRLASAAAASYYLDVAVYKGLIQSPNDYQLVALTSLYLALKVYDSPCLRVIKLGSFVKLGNGELSEDDILRMEWDLINVLGWRLNPPTANCFLQQYLTLLPSRRLFHGEDPTISNNNTNSNNNNNMVRDRIKNIALHAIEQATTRDNFLSIPVSIIAYSAILFAIETLDLQQYYSSSLSSPHLTCWQVETFLLRMAHVANLDSTSNPTVLRCVMLLGRTLKDNPIPASCIINKRKGCLAEQQPSKSKAIGRPYQHLQSVVATSDNGYGNGVTVVERYESDKNSPKHVEVMRY
ncbi:cyclin-like protein [Nitzschia inconspicua]|uniref:Cyclin-like protein n=1 Tax=Nitzschia inconspicua TaxID=303405 RepID=A0A9K3Q4A0_9STRA|nr:cyclin-like protein [Nitzschia inconspicua]